VRASQRERLMRAVVELVGEKGYAATTLPELAALARVSPNAIYQHFDDKTDCFIAVCDEAATEILEQLLELASAPDWLTAVSEGMNRYLHWWAERPAFTRAYFLELPVAGERALEQRDRQYERFRDMFRALAARARAEQPELGELPEVAVRALVPGITEIIAEEVRAGRTGRLLELHDELVWLVVRTLADDATADKVAPGGKARAA
jgi:AcrR family transcriptional regulator